MILLSYLDLFITITLDLQQTEMSGPGYLRSTTFNQPSLIIDWILVVVILIKNFAEQKQLIQK